MKRIINTDKAPKAIGAYSQAVEINGILYISGQLPLSAETGQIVEGGIKAQTKQVMENIKAILFDAGYELKDVVKSTCLLSDLSNFQDFNKVYSTYYTENPPARAAFAVKELPLKALIEVETIAIK